MILFVGGLAEYSTGIHSEAEDGFQIIYFLIPPLFQVAKEPGTNGSGFSISSGIFVCHSKLKPCALITASRRRILLKLSLMKKNEQMRSCSSKICSSTATLVMRTALCGTIG